MGGLHKIPPEGGELVCHVSSVREKRENGRGLLRSLSRYLLEHPNLHKNAKRLEQKGREKEELEGLRRTFGGNLIRGRN